METAIIVALISLTGTIVTSAIAILPKVIESWRERQKELERRKQEKVEERPPIASEDQSKQYTVFPLTEVYSFAKQTGGAFATLVFAIKDWQGFPETLRSYNSFSQVRRTLCYIALQQGQLWNQFVSKYWPTANSPRARAIIAELENDFINNGLLTKHAHTLPPETRTLRLSK